MSSFWKVWPALSSLSSFIFSFPVRKKYCTRVNMRPSTGGSGTYGHKFSRILFILISIDSPKSRILLTVPMGSGPPLIIYGQKIKLVLLKIFRTFHLKMHDHAKDWPTPFMFTINHASTTIHPQYQVGALTLTWYWVICPTICQFLNIQKIFRTKLQTSGWYRSIDNFILYLIIPKSARALQKWRHKMQKKNRKLPQIFHACKLH